MSFTQFLWKNYLRILHPSCTIKASSLSRNVKFENDVTFEYGSHIQASFIGKYTYINKYCLIDKNTASIGRFCSIAYNVKIGMGNHPVNWGSTHPFAYEKKYGFIEKSMDFEGKVLEKTEIGNDVWIGVNAIVLAGVKVGDGAVIGANSLVNKDVEPYAIVYGSPAQFKKYRFSEKVRKELLSLKWWDKPESWIRANIDKFRNPEELTKNSEL
ncbi:MAG: CatB-related O-acetyltransferase [Bacteroidales bacterium]|nr:CatB-related O-acetyltransferase [Bacteroidales bacterium]